MRPTSGLSPPNATSGSTKFTFSAVNNTGSSVSGFVINWNTEQFNNAGRATTVDLLYRINAGAYSSTGITGTTTFYVTVTTGECIAYDSVTVFQEALTGVTDISISTACSGTDVQLFATGEGGGEPYSYSWSDGQASSTATGLAPGTYTVIVTDVNGCSTNCASTITEPSAISLSHRSQAISI